MANERFKKVLWKTTIIQECLIFISKNAYGIKHRSFNLAIVHKCNLECLQSRKHCEAIMDDVLLFTPSKRAHMSKLEDLLKALLKNRLKISPKKCQLFKIELWYMWNAIFLKGRKVCVKPLGSILEAI